MPRLAAHSIFSRTLGSLLVVVALAGILPGCQQIEPNESSSVFRIEGDTAWQAYSRLIIVIAEPGGDVLDTLFNDSLKSLSDLHELQASQYQGGQVLIGIFGYRGTVLVYSQGREFDGASQQVLAIQDSIPVIGNPTPITVVSTTNPTQGQVKTTPTSDTLPKILPPTFSDYSRDTTISIRDMVPMFAVAQAGGSRILKVTWDYESDGRIDDSTTKVPSGSRFTASPRYQGIGLYVCRVVVHTAAGKAQADIRVTVIQDPPVADAGQDTTVAPGTTIYLHAKGSDGYGPIVKREWQIGSAAFKAIGQQETQILAPNIEGDLRCILRITDSDGLTALDTMMVFIRNPDSDFEEPPVDGEEPNEVILEEEIFE